MKASAKTTFTMSQMRQHRSKIPTSVAATIPVVTVMVMMITVAVTTSSSSSSWTILPLTSAFVVVRHTAQQHHHLRSPSTIDTFGSSFVFPRSSNSNKNKNNIIPMQATPMNDDDDDNNVDPSVSVTSPKKVTTQPTPVLWSALTERHKVAAMTALTILLSTSAIVSSFSLPADAAMSGGRMGGSFSRSSSSFGGGGGGSRMRMAPSSRSYYNGGGGGGYYGGPRTTIVAPIISPFATPFYNPMVPYYGGGVGAISYARGPGLFDVLFLGGIGFFVLSAISNTIRSTAQSSLGQWDDSRDSNNNMFGLATTAAASPTTVFKCNVALEVSNRDDPNSILSVLDRMAKVTAKTDTRKGVVTLTKQVALELLRRKSSIYSAAGTIQQYKNDKEAQRTYNQWSIQERSKFEQENVNKFNQFDLSLMKQKDDIDRDVSLRSSSKATMAVVTLVVSVDGSALMNVQNMKQIQSLSDVETMLQAIASMSSDNTDHLYGAEILWTPEDRSETLSKKDILADYPELNVL